MGAEEKDEERDSETVAICSEVRTKTLLCPLAKPRAGKREPLASSMWSAGEERTRSGVISLVILVLFVGRETSIYFLSTLLKKKKLTKGDLRVRFRESITRIGDFSPLVVHF